MDNGSAWLGSFGRGVGVHKQADVLTGAWVEARIKAGVLFGARVEAQMKAGALSGALVEVSSDLELDLHVAIWEEPHVGDRDEAQVAPDVGFLTKAPYLSHVGCWVQLHWADNYLKWGRTRVSYVMRLWTLG